MPSLSSHDERIVLCFHGIGTPPAADAGGARYWCDHSAFEAMLDRIADINAAAECTPIQITFDDGNSSDYESALPALLERDLTADFFVCAGRLDTEGYVSSAQVREMHQAGMRIGSHGWDHVDWRCADDLDLEMRGSLMQLASVVGEPVHDVAIPFGSYDRRVLGKLRQVGCRRAYTSDPGRTTAQAWMVRRETVTNTWDERTIVALTHSPARMAARMKLFAARALKALR